jgi:hypothetical protein
MTETPRTVPTFYLIPRSRRRDRRDAGRSHAKAQLGRRNMPPLCGPQNLQTQQHPNKQKS